MNLCHPVRIVPLRETPDCSIRFRQERWLDTSYLMGGTEAQLEVAPLNAVAAHTEANLDDSLCRRHPFSKAREWDSGTVVQFYRVSHG